jgi:hypothetical protein
MRLFLTVLIGGIISFALALGLVLFVTQVLPCHEDRASCGMGQAYSIIATMIVAPLVMLVFGFTVWLAPGERGIAIAAVALSAPVAGILLFAMILNGLPRDIGREMQGLLAFYVPPLLIVGVQWVVLRGYMRRPASKGA